MILGNYSLDPRRILTANYSQAKHNIYAFKVGYIIGENLIDITQLGSKKECKKWLQIANSVIGKGPLLDAIATRELEDEDLDDSTTKSKIGFVTND